jgi:hypothetical protein
MSLGSPKLLIWEGDRCFHIFSITPNFLVG